MKIELKGDPLMPHLVEIASQPESRGAILMGGFGLRLKREHLRLSGERTLIPPMPEIRATQDLDIYLGLQFWIENDKEKAKAYNAMLIRLGYKVTMHNWHFRKKMREGSAQNIRLDLHSRSPIGDEVDKVKVKGNPKQVGKSMGTGVTGRETPEAFSIERDPKELIISHEGVECIAIVPHPYAWLNLKARAAYDWLRERRGDSEITPKRNEETGDYLRLKHVYDVYALVAMLTEREIERASQFAEEFREATIAAKIREEAVELFGNPDAEGIRGIEFYAQRSFQSNRKIDYELFWNEGLVPALGLER